MAMTQLLMCRIVTLLVSTGLAFSLFSASAWAEEPLRFPESFRTAQLPQTEQVTGRLYQCATLYAAAGNSGPGADSTMRFSRFYEFLRDEIYSPDEIQTAPHLMKVYAPAQLDRAYVRVSMRAYRLGPSQQSYLFTMLEAIRALPDGRLVIEASIAEDELLRLSQNGLGITGAYPSEIRDYGSRRVLYYSACGETRPRIAAPASIDPLPQNPSLGSAFEEPAIREIADDFLKAAPPSEKDLFLGERWNCSMHWAVSPLAFSTGQTPALLFKREYGNYRNVFMLDGEREIAPRIFETRRTDMHSRELQMVARLLWQVDYKKALANPQTGVFFKSYETIRKVAADPMQGRPEDYLIVERSMSNEDLQQVTRAYQDYLGNTNFRLTGRESPLRKGRTVYMYQVCGRGFKLPDSPIRPSF